ncbi:MAG: hypothetical protein ACI9TV_002877 [Sulfurimonas sp.]
MNDRLIQCYAESLYKTDQVNYWVGFIEENKILSFPLSLILLSPWGIYYFIFPVNNEFQQKNNAKFLPLAFSFSNIKIYLIL